MVADITLQSAIDQQSQTSAASASLAEDFTQFLTLLTTQLQNQDPLSPMDSTEFTNQLVAFTQVEQQINSNEKLDNLVALGISETMSNAQSYVGSYINYVSSEFYFDGTEQTIRYSLPQSAASATMRITNEDGVTVYQEEINSLAGAHNATWDGRLTGGGIASDGTYEIQIDALDATGKAIDATTAVRGRVKGVESQNGQVFLLVGERAVALSNVLNSEIDEGQNITESVTSALNYVGMDVGYEDHSFIYTNEDVDLSYTLAADADRAKIHIYNDVGSLVFTDDASTSEGLHTYTWDGDNLPAGQYTFEIDALVQPKTTLKSQENNYSGDDISVPYTLEQSYDSVELQVYVDGDLIETKTLKTNAGAHSYSYSNDSNLAVDGDDIEFRVVATSDVDENISYTSGTVGRVTGVEIDNGVVFLQLGPTKVVPLSEISSVAVPEEPESDTDGEG